MIRTLVPCLALAIVAPARSQERPPTAPTRDVEVVYQASAAGQTVEQRSRFAVAAGKVRIDTPSPGLYVVVDLTAGRMDMVSEGDRRVLELPYDPAHTVGGVAADSGFERLGADTVAGLPCTEWRTADRGGRPISVCMTADGVLLRARAGANVLVLATRVTYGAVDPGIFAVPAGYQRAPKREAVP